MKPDAFLGELFMRLRLISALLWGFIITLYNLPAFAWQVTLQPDDTPAQVVVSNERDWLDVMVYLVWFDMDKEPASDQFVSLKFSENGQPKWQPGLMPAFNTPIDLAAFDSYNIAFENQACPESHRCFLAFVATLPDQNPLVSDSWQVSSFLPLSLSAGCERFRGQQFFLSCDSRGFLTIDNGGVNEIAILDSGAVAPELAAETQDTPAKVEADTVDTEKPDIFRLVEDKLLYANGAAKRFQVIDIADFSNPILDGWTALSGSPRELYVLGDYYLLLQTNYVGEDGTHLTVLSQGEDGSLTIVHDMTLPGQFIESRRRGEFIYSVTQNVTQNRADLVVLDCVDCGYSQYNININVLRLKDSGQLEVVDKAQLPGYSPTIAIFPDYLVITNHNPEEQKWQTTQIQAFNLSQNDDPLVDLPTLKVPGQVPSEFHLSVLNQHLRVVYGPEDRQDGSTLAIYDLSSPELALIGKIGDIAPGEDLFATRFVDNRAFVVTFERTDPLWVIDLSEPTAPKILGELEVPGWSEKMFFHDDRLFAVGIDDQPLANEENRWVRRVSMSLFDVKDPTKPSLINRFTPLTDEVSYSSSPALDDERALLLDWDNAYAALPIVSNDAETGNHLQIVSLANDKIEDAGRLDSPIEIQRSLSIAPDVLAALGDQALLTLRWGQGDPQLLGELELATNLTWLELQEDNLWAAAIGNQGYHRFYRYTTENVETPTQRWSLPRGYDGLEMDGNLVVFYNNGWGEPLTVQVLDVSTGVLRPLQVLENTVEGQEVSPESSSVEKEPFLAPDIWHSRSQPLVHDGWFYVAEQRTFKPTPLEASILPPLPEKDFWQPQSLLRGWNLTVEDASEVPSRSIPGQPLAFTVNGKLITREFANSGELRLNLLALGVDNAVLLESRDLPCQGYSQVMWADDAVYVNCKISDGYVYVTDFEEGANDDVATSSEDNAFPSTQLLKLKPEQGFAEVGSWTLPGSQYLRVVSSEVVLVASEYGWYDILEKPVINVKTSLAPRQSGCDIYQLIPEQEPVQLKHLDSCSYADDMVVLTRSEAWEADGFAGIKEIIWEN